MKKFLGIALALMMFGCDFGTESKKEVPIPKDTTKTIIRKTVVEKDTNVNVSYSMNISGKVSEKNSSGNTIGGFSAIVCLEHSGKCTKTNSKGQYSFSTPKTSMIAGRMFAESDTTQTPENIQIPNDVPDTVINLDTTIIQDTIIQNDSIIIVDTLDIVETISIDGDTTNTDTAIVYKDSKILYEIPVNSWKEVLPEKYIVQRNIDVKVSMARYFNELKSVEAVFWNTDSIALVITLGNNSDEENSYSGFIYQPYNDSSYKNDIKVNNVFVRAIDKNDSVYSMSEVLQYSERIGDIRFGELILGNVLRYPKPVYFRAIEDGESVKIIPNTQTFPVGEIDSIHARPQFTKDSVKSDIETKMSYKFDSIAVILLKSGIIDSVSVMFVSEIDTVVKYKITTVVDSIEIKKGLNVVNLKWSEKYLNQDIFYVSFPMPMISNLRAFIKFKE